MGFLIPKSKTGMIVRVVCAAIIIVGCGAATTAVAGLLEIKTLVKIIQISQPIKSKRIKLPAPGKPQTILLIGSDHRAHEPFSEANTDTMLLMRLDPASSTINVLSIPRDLEVNIPGHGIAKINAAYSLGSYGLLIKTIQQDVFPKFQPNHVIDTNFEGFSDLVDAIGCVYTDVDHRYFNQSALGPNDYSSIDIEPGYQKLCGKNQSVHGALPFVRFRHTDNDILRNARQQDFIRWAKQGFSTSRLLSERDRLLSVFSKHSSVDEGLRSFDGLLTMFRLLVNLNGATIKQVKFPAVLPAADSLTQFVTADSAAEQQAYQDFLRPTKAAPKPKPKKKTKPAGHAHAKQGKHAPPKPAIDVHGLSNDQLDGLHQAQSLPHPRMPVFYPKLLGGGSTICWNQIANCQNGFEPGAAYAHSYPREYVIPDGSGKKVPAYRMTIALNDVLDEYYGIQGVHWKNPPILAHPTATETIHGRKLFLYKEDGSHLTTVAFHVGDNSYWVSNTLDSELPNSQMIGIAATLLRYHGHKH
jgi:polyisoprenyl-teichoic acid--peptidoglycan teichoic acid transferase